MICRPGYTGPLCCQRVFAAAFILAFIGYIVLRGDAYWGDEGKKGILMLIIAYALVFVGNVFDFVPFVGDKIAGFFYMASLVLIPFGWLGVQKDVIEKAGGIE